jgi:hypothetical protein
LVWKHKEAELSHKLYFRFTRDSDAAQLIYFNFDGNRKGTEIGRLERQQPGAEGGEFQILLRAFDIANYYRGDAEVFKRTATIAFEAAKALATYLNSTFELGGEVVKLATDANPSRGEYYKEHALQIGSSYWKEFNKIKSYVSRKCDNAKQYIAFDSER